MEKDHISLPQGRTDTLPDKDICKEKKLINVDVDEVWKFLGRPGRYQMVQMILLLTIYISSSHFIVGGMFTGKEVAFKCSSPNNATSVTFPINTTNVVTSCSVNTVNNVTSDILSTEACSEYVYEENSKHRSYISEWDLVCDKETLGQLPQVLVMIGMCLGAAFLPQLGDRFGRKSLCFCSHIVLYGVTFLCGFVQHVEFFFILKLLIGIFQQGALVPCYIMQIEVVPVEMRTFIGVINVCVWSLSLCWAGLVSYLFRHHDWRVLQFALTASTVPFMLLFLFIDETLMWLLANSKHGKADAVLRKACKMNKKDYNQLMNILTEDKSEKLSLVSSTESDNTANEEDGFDFIQVIKNGSLRKITIISCYTWMICSLTYYGLTMMSTSLAGDPYVNFLLMSLVDFPSSIMTYYVMQRFGRKRTLISCTLVAALALLVTVFVATFSPESSSAFVVRTVFCVIGKFCISGSFGIVWLYTSELYPTNLRNFGIGISSMAARFGAIFSPLFTILSRKAIWAPGVLFSTGCLISVCLLTFLPETRWCDLPKTIQDVEIWFEREKTTTPPPEAEDNSDNSNNVDHKTGKEEKV